MWDGNVLKALSDRRVRALEETGEGMTHSDAVGVASAEQMRARSEGATWGDVVAAALAQLGGEAHLKELTPLAELHPKAKGNKNVDAKVRQVVRRDARIEFTGTAGVYRLKDGGADDQK
jgi:hypothetical protein